MGVAGWNLGHLLEDDIEMATWIHASSNRAKLAPWQLLEAEGATFRWG